MGHNIHITHYIKQHYKGIFPSLSADIDECSLFGEEICKKGRCENTQPGYECYCQQGFYYDGNLLECIGKCFTRQNLKTFCKNAAKTLRLLLFLVVCSPSDVNECHDEALCTNGNCVNTEGSFYCNCKRPWTPDSNKQECVIATVAGETENHLPVSLFCIHLAARGIILSFDTTFLFYRRQ